MKCKKLKKSERIMIYSNLMIELDVYLQWITEIWNSLCKKEMNSEILLPIHWLKHIANHEKQFREYSYASNGLKIFEFGITFEFTFSFWFAFLSNIHIIIAQIGNSGINWIRFSVERLVSKTKVEERFQFWLKISSIIFNPKNSLEFSSRMTQNSDPNSDSKVND